MYIYICVSGRGIARTVRLWPELYVISYSLKRVTEGQLAVINDEDYMTVQLHYIYPLFSLRATS